jgi:hypothetical protein
MEISINVSGNRDMMNQADWQSIRRCASMLMGHGFIVEIVWDSKPTKVIVLTEKVA